MVIYKMFGSRIACFLVLGLCVQSFYFGVGSKKLCLQFKMTNDNYHFSYQVNAQTPQALHMVATNMNGLHITTFTETNRMYDLPGHEPIQICMQSTDEELKSVSIDMWSDSASAIKTLASKSDIYELHAALVKAAAKAHDISRQEKFQEDRQRIHTDIIVQNEDTVKRYGIAKILIVVLMAGVQVFLFKRLFKDDNRLSI